MREPGKVSIYLCGPTVYAPPHLGHGRQNVVYDVLVRYLRWSGVDVRLVSNVTDIDDQIINRANAEGRPWQDITAKCEAVWFDAQARLGVARPDDTPHATEYVDEMVAMIGQLVEIGRGLHHRRRRLPRRSRPSRTTACSPTSRSTTCSPAAASGRSFGADQKRHPADFVLWKLAKPGEPSWPSPWGDGRPGWHSECVVMSLDLLGEGFDLHCGGMDLRFPHHENERAQAVALGKRFANHWMHHAFVVDAEGEKMSKSLGNVDNLLDLLDRYDERDVPHAAAAEPLPQPGARRRREPAGAPSGRWPASTRSPPAARRPRRRRRRRRARRVLGGDGRRPRHAGGDGRRCSTPCAGPTRRSTRATPRPARSSAAVRGDGRRRRPRARPHRRGPGRRARAGRRARRGPGGQGLRRRRRHPRRAAGGRLDRRDDRSGDDRPPVSPRAASAARRSGELPRPTRDLADDAPTLRRMLRPDVTPRSLQSGRRGRGPGAASRWRRSRVAGRRCPGRLGYQPGLDGLRGLSVLAVIGYHAGFGWLRGGWIGVEVFFVVSGFLITSLLVEEREAHGRRRPRAGSGCAGPAGCCRRSA